MLSEILNRFEALIWPIGCKKNRNMFDKLKIRTRLIVGFAVIIILMLIVTLVSFESLSIGSKGFKEYRSIARITNITGRIQANMLKLRMHDV